MPRRLGDAPRNASTASRWESSDEEEVRDKKSKKKHSK
jgi:hypothetical protein